MPPCAALGADPGARQTFASLCGARALNLVVGPFGEGRENRGLLSWHPLFVPAPVRALPPPEHTAEEHARWIVGFARRAGALAAGVASLNRDWVYERVQLNPYAAGAP